MRAAFLLKDRSDQELLDGVFAAVAREFEDVALVVAHIAEMDKRKLFTGQGCSCLKAYCMEVLNLTEDQAYARVSPWPGWGRNSRWCWTCWRMGWFI
jgi:hypothetical protein